MRDIDPLPNWVNGRVVLIGDAAHAMLPLQGQGASQSVEDAEALEAFFSHVKGQPSRTEIDEALKVRLEATGCSDGVGLTICITRYSYSTRPERNELP